MSTSTQLATFGGGCFWCIDAAFRRVKGVLNVSSGYTGGHTDNPTYKSVCSGTTGHAEVVQLEFDSAVVSFETLLSMFFTLHDATQLNRQGNDIGSQYRSAIFTTTEAQLAAAQKSAEAFQEALQRADRGRITTEIKPLDVFYYAEAYHQQYLDKNPGGYCGLKGTGVTCPIG